MPGVADGWLQTLEDAPDCQAYSISGGHWFMLDQPDEVVARVRAFL